MHTCGRGPVSKAAPNWMGTASNGFIDSFDFLRGQTSSHATCSLEAWVNICLKGHLFKHGVLHNKVCN